MKKITFEVETITPMFLSGADQNKAELRAASIKGLMRFWWRALQAENNAKKLLEEEANIFGAPEEKIGGSKFSIRVTQPDKKPLHFNSQGRHDPVGYMFYSTFMQKDRKRPYFPEDSKFKIIMSSRNEDSLKIAAASLWALIYLGGLGTRIRRGAGNMVVTNIEDTAGILNGIGLNFMPKGNNSNETAKWLIDNLKSAKQQIVDKTGFASEYSNLSFSRFVISNKGFTTWREALGATRFKTFRDSNKARIFETASFGFPIIHRSSHTTVTGSKPYDKRRGSPLVFKVIRANNKFYWIVIRLAGELLPEGGVITANGNTQKPDYGIIDEFWAELKKTGREHILSMPDTLDHIKNELVKQTAPTKIILFGSKARGDFHSRSDTDIAVEADKQLGKLFHQGAIDIVDLKRVDERLKKKIEKEGVVIYERKS